MTNTSETQTFRRVDNLHELLAHRVGLAPRKSWLFSEADGREFSYEEFMTAVNRTARMLASHGVSKGDVVSLLMPNSAEYIIAYFACWKLGAIAGPINSLLKAQEIAFVISDSETKALLAHSDFLPTIESIRRDLPGLRAVIMFDDEAAATKDFKTDSTSANSTSSSLSGLNLPDIDCDSEAIIIYTSGTTGKPKGCLLTHGNLIANARQISEWLGFTKDDRLLTIMPLFHMNAVSVTTMSALYAGGSTVVSPKFSASRFWQIISDYQITSFGSVATMLSMLLTTYPDGVPKGLTTDQLRFAMCGSAPVPAEVMKRFEETFNCLVIEGYGLSESTCRSTFNPPNERRRPGSCGKPIGNEMRVVDDNDVEVADGELGEVVLRGENILKGYYRNPEATATAFRNGWFHTGDIGYRDMEGFFYIVDRKSDMIIRGGENIYPREIDEVLYQHPLVAAAATIGVPDQLYGEEVAAFIVLKEGREATEEEIVAFCRARLADYKCPKTVRFIKEIPKGPTGKLLKRELAREFKTSS
ncbi:MAG TPA: long-chain-fatty-acid--CoA ligase [Pyrinomonadaceae bacterium]|jgi:long-chain acyl-CoA synthetase|nr:long-chain-fatty-acid--CoA ligase [Pyrinomonadaceae bacterium]